MVSDIEDIHEAMTPEQLRYWQVGFRFEPESFDDCNMMVSRAVNRVAHTSSNLLRARKSKMPLWFRQDCARSRWEAKARCRRVRRYRDRMLDNLLVVLKTRVEDEEPEDWGCECQPDGTNTGG